MPRSGTLKSRPCRPSTARNGRVCCSRRSAKNNTDEELLVSLARPTRTPEVERESAWSVLVLAEGGTPDQSYVQIGGAPSRAHVRTDPGCSVWEEQASMEGSFVRRCSQGKACVSAFAGLGG